MHPSGPTRGHSHSPSAIAVHMRPMAARIVVGVLVACAIAVAVGAVVLWPGERPDSVPLQFQTAAPDGKLQTQTGR